MMQPAGKWECCHVAFANMTFGREGLYPPTDPTFDSKAPTLKLGHARLFERVLKESFPPKQFAGLEVKKESDIWAAVLPKLKDCESYDSMVKRISKATGAKPLSSERSIKRVAPEINTMMVVVKGRQVAGSQLNITTPRDDANHLIEELVALDGKVEWAPYSNFRNQCKAFTKWVDGGCVKAFPPSKKQVKINCWEAVLTAAFHAGLASAAQLKDTFQAQAVMDGVFNFITRFVRGSIVISQEAEATGSKNLIRPGDLLVCRRRPVKGGPWEIGHVGVALNACLKDWKKVRTLSLHHQPDSRTKAGELPLTEFLLNEPDKTFEVITYSRL